MIRLRLTERAEEDLSDVFAWIANYLIFYLLEKNALTVVRVLHGARDLEKGLFQGITSIAALLEESN